MDTQEITLRKYDHLERQGHRNTRGIEEGRVFVFPKLDGTNAAVWFENGLVRCGSRKRVITPGKDNDNAGFAAWVYSDDPVAMNIREFLARHTSYILYGEWLVPHTLKTYRDDAWRRFWVFDVFRNVEGEERGYESYEVYKAPLEEAGIDFIDPIAIYTNPTGAQLKGETENNDFLIAEGAGIGEGVVVKNYEWRREGSHDRVWGKFVRSEFKSSHRRTMGAPEKEGKQEIERLIAEQFVTSTLVQKNLAKVITEVLNGLTAEQRFEIVQGGQTPQEYVVANFRSRVIPQLLGRVWNDLIEEEMWGILKKHKGVTIDFKRFQALTTITIKTLVPELF